MSFLSRYVTRARQVGRYGPHCTALEARQVSSYLPIRSIVYVNPSRSIALDEKW